MRKLFTFLCAAMMLPAAAQWNPGDFSQAILDSVGKPDMMSYNDPVMIRKADGTTLIAYESRGRHINPKTGQRTAEPMFYLHYQKLDKDGNKMFPGHGIYISSQPNLNASFSEVKMDTLPNGNIVFDYADIRRTSGETSELTFVGDGLKAYAYCYTQDGEPVWSPDGVQLPMYKHDSAALGRAYMGQQIGVSGEYIYFGSVMLEQVNEWVDTAYVGMFHYYRELVCMDKDGNILAQRVDSAYPSINFAFSPAPNGDMYMIYVREDVGYNAELLGPDLQNKWPDAVRVEDYDVIRHEGQVNQSYTPDEMVTLSDSSVALVYYAFPDIMRSFLVYNRLYPDGNVLGHVVIGDTLGQHAGHTCIFEGDTLTVFSCQNHNINSLRTEYYLYLNSIKLDGTKLHPETPYGYWLNMDNYLDPKLIGAVKAGGNYHLLTSELDGFYNTYQSYCYTVTPNGEKVGRKPILGTFKMADRAFYSEGNLAQFIFTMNANGGGGLWNACIDVTDDTNIQQETDALNGKFTVNAEGKQIVFSKSNLEFWNKIPTLQFGTKQWEEQNTANKWIDYNGDIRWYDLFGWGTGDEWNKTNTDSTAYAIYTDWGNNPIRNNSLEPGIWRAMSADEWDYLLTKRENADTKWSLGTAHLGINTEERGLILLPDEFEFPDTLEVIPNVHDFSTNKYIPAEWARLEANGAVFIPMGSYRIGTEIHGYNKTQEFPTEGFYWTSTPDGDNYAKAIHIDSNGWTSQSAPRSYGMSVRLVKDAEGSEEGIEDVVVSDKQNNEARKVLINGQLFIEKNGKIYNAQGAEVK